MHTTQGRGNSYAPFDSPDNEPVELLVLLQNLGHVGPVDAALNGGRCVSNRFRHPVCGISPLDQRERLALAPMVRANILFRALGTLLSTPLFRQYLAPLIIKMAYPLSTMRHQISQECGHQRAHAPPKRRHMRSELDNPRPETSPIPLSCTTGEAIGKEWSNLSGREVNHMSLSCPYTYTHAHVHSQYKGRGGAFTQLGHFLPRELILDREIPLLERIYQLL